MNLPELSDDPEELTAAARHYLREKFLRVKIGVCGANFLVAETGSVCIVESEGNGRMCLTMPRGADLHRRHREDHPGFPGHGSFPAVAAALRHRRAHESLQLAVDRRSPRRWPAAFPRRPAGQRTHPHPCGPGIAPDAALHPLRRLPQHLPRLSADRRPRLWLELLRAHRRDCDTAVVTNAARAVAALRVFAVRRVLRSLPGENQHSRSADSPARPGGARAKKRPRSRSSGDEDGCGHLRQPRALRSGTAPGADRPVAARVEGLDAQPSRHAGQLDPRARSARAAAADVS